MLEISGYYSLGIQFITGLIDMFGLLIKVPDNKLIFRDLLKVELGVQSIEFVFYMWMIYNFKNIKNITPYRYLDWFITTPIMLITFMAYLDNNNYTNINNFVIDNKNFIIKITFLNFLMLLFGLFGELNVLPYILAIFIGFIPFLYYFYLIYDKYYNNKEISQDKKFVFWFFFIFWSLYGISALMKYKTKNIMYNILDLFSKNGFGLFLVYILWKNRI